MAVSPRCPRPRGAGRFYLSEHLRKRIEIGILFSQGSDYDLLSQASREGALKGIAAVNADPARQIAFAPVERNPAGRAESYGALCAEILCTGSARHVVGCTTSWSRKEVIPALERHGGMLWYAAPYEGFEASEHVVYLHACPNQHIVPLLNYVFPRWGADAFLLGSNYVWGWELNRVARDIVGEWSGRVLGERYLPLGDADVSRIIAEIRATRPSFVLNNLIGQSSYAFLKAYAALGSEDRAFLPENCPVLSCDLMEPELAALDGCGEETSSSARTSPIPAAIVRPRRWRRRPMPRCWCWLNSSSRRAPMTRRALPSCSAAGASGHRWGRS